MARSQHAQKWVRLEKFRAWGERHSAAWDFLSGQDLEAGLEHPRLSSRHLKAWAFIRLHGSGSSSPTNSSIGIPEAAIEVRNG